MNLGLVTGELTGLLAILVPVSHRNLILLLSASLSSLVKVLLLTNHRSAWPSRDHFSANHSSPDQCWSFGLAPAVVVAAVAVVGGRLQTQVVQVDRGCEEGQPEQVGTS